MQNESLLIPSTVTNQEREEALFPSDVVIL